MEEIGFAMGIKGKRESGEGLLICKGRWTRSTDARDFHKIEFERTRGPAWGRGEMREKGGRGLQGSPRL